MCRCRHSIHTLLHRQWVVGWLLFALPLLGLTANLSAMLGQMHFHRAVVEQADPLAGWTDFRRVVPKATEHAQPQTHSHSHGQFERHHHDRDDTVVGIDSADHAADASTDGAASASLAGLTLAMPPGTPWAVGAGERQAGPAGVSGAIATRTPVPLERPPKPVIPAPGP